MVLCEVYQHRKGVMPLARRATSHTGENFSNPKMKVVLN